MASCHEELVLRTFGAPLLELLHEAAAVHRASWSSGDIERCQLLSIKTGGCPEDCAYCAQSAHNDTDTENTSLLSIQEILGFARSARERGVHRLCLSAAWPTIPSAGAFSVVLEAIRGARALGLEVCCTLGALSSEQAGELKQAGLDFYNHNLDTSPEFYSRITSTHSFEDRLATIRRVREAGVHLCCGGILGLGESRLDRARLLAALASLSPPPEVVPVNLLVRIPGTPLENLPELDPFELVRFIAAARVLFPSARIRLSAGRSRLSREVHLLCFVAGANSLFIGGKLLTAPLPGDDFDNRLFADVLERPGREQ